VPAPAPGVVVGVEIGGVEVGGVFVGGGRGVFVRVGGGFVTSITEIAVAGWNVSPGILAVVLLSSADFCRMER